MLLPLLLLLAYGIAFGQAALGGVLAFDDHPGQLYRVYHAVSIGLAPWRLNTGWWGGYAELQYYPPGAAWLGAALAVRVGTFPGGFFASCALATLGIITAPARKPVKTAFL